MSTAPQNTPQQNFRYQVVIVFKKGGTDSIMENCKTRGEAEDIYNMKDDTVSIAYVRDWITGKMIHQYKFTP